MNKVRVTLDHNCLIALEKTEHNSIYIKKILQMENEGMVELVISSIGASEKTKNPVIPYSRFYSDFVGRLRVMGINTTPTLTAARWDMSYYDASFFGTIEITNLEQQIHHIIHPKIPYSYKEYCHAQDVDPKNQRAEKRWRNAICDTITMWTHITNNGDIFVSADKKAFHSADKKAALIKLGVKNIVLPIDTEECIKCLL